MITVGLLALGLGLIALYFVFSIYFVMGNPISSCFLVFLTDNWEVLGGLTVIAGLYIVQYGSVWVGGGLWGKFAV